MSGRPKVPLVLTEAERRGTRGADTAAQALALRGRVSEQTV